MKQLTLLALSVMLAGGAQAYTCSSNDNSIGTTDEQYDDGIVYTVGSDDCIGVVDGNDNPINVTVALGREIKVRQDVSLTFESWFSEAGWTNQFGWKGQVLLDNAPVIKGQSFSDSFSPDDDNFGLLPFFYNTNVTGALSDRVDNGVNQRNYEGSLPTFAFAYYEGYYYLGLNDNGIQNGSNGDFDVDDFVVRFKVNADVPEPAGTALLGLGMVGLGLSRLARRKVG